MKILFAISLLMTFFAGYSHAKSCGTKTQTCWSFCDNGYVTVGGDTCETTWDFNRGCYSAKGTCSAGNQTCNGNSTSCWDPCTNSFVTLQDANSCTTGWSFAKGCYAAVGLCN